MCIILVKYSEKLNEVVIEIGTSYEYQCDNEKKR